MNPLESFFVLDDFVMSNLLAIMFLVLWKVTYLSILFYGFMFFALFGFWWYFAEKERIRKFRETPMRRL